MSENTHFGQASQLALLISKVTRLEFLLYCITKSLSVFSVKLKFFSQKTTSKSILLIFKIKLDNLKYTTNSLLAFLC